MAFSLSIDVRKLYKTPEPPMRRLWLLLLFLPLGLLTARDTAQRFSWQEPLPVVRVGLVAADLGSLDASALRYGVRTKAAELGEKLELDIHVLDVTPREPGSESRRKAFSALYLADVYGAIVQLPHPDGEEVPTDLLAEAGAPIISVLGERAPAGCIATITTDPYTAGALAYRALEQNLGPRDHDIVILAGPVADKASAARLRGFQDAAADSEKKLRFQTRHTEADYGAARSTLQQIIDDDFAGDIDALAMLGDWAMTGGDPLPWAAGAYRVVAVGARPADIAALLSGQVQALVDERPFQVGERAMEVLLENYSQGLNKGELRQILIAPVIITGEEAPDLLRRWNDWLK